MPIASSVNLKHLYVTMSFLLLEAGLTKSKRTFLDKCIQKTTAFGYREANDISRNSLTTNPSEAVTVRSSTNCTVAIHSSEFGRRISGSLGNGDTGAQSASGGINAPGIGICVPENGMSASWNGIVVPGNGSSAEVNGTGVPVNRTDVSETKVSASENEIGVSWSGTDFPGSEFSVLWNGFGAPPGNGTGVSENVSVSRSNVSCKEFCFPEKSSVRIDNLITSAEMKTLRPNVDNQTTDSFRVLEKAACHSQVVVFKNEASEACKPKTPSSNQRQIESQFTQVGLQNLLSNISIQPPETHHYTSNTTKLDRDMIVDRACQPVLSEEPFQLQTLEIPAALASTFANSLPPGRPTHPDDTQRTVTQSSSSDEPIPRSGGRAGSCNLSRKVVGEYRSKLCNERQEIQDGTTATVGLRNDTNKASRLLSVRTDRRRHIAGSPSDCELHRTFFQNKGKRNSRAQCSPTHRLGTTCRVPLPHNRENPTLNQNCTEPCRSSHVDATSGLRCYKPITHSLGFSPSFLHLTPRLMCNEAFLTQRPLSSETIRSQQSSLPPSFIPLAPTPNLPQDHLIPPTFLQKPQLYEPPRLAPSGRPQSGFSRSYPTQDTTKYKPSRLSKGYNPTQIRSPINKSAREWFNFDRYNSKTPRRDVLKNFDLGPELNCPRCLVPDGSFQKQFLYSRDNHGFLTSLLSLSDPNYYERGRCESPGLGSEVRSDAKTFCNDPAIHQLLNLRERMVLLRRANSLLGVKLCDSRTTLEPRLQQIEKRSVMYGCHDNTTAASAADDAEYLIQL